METNKLHEAHPALREYIQPANRSHRFRGGRGVNVPIAKRTKWSSTRNASTARQTTWRSRAGLGTIQPSRQAANQPSLTAAPHTSMEPSTPAIPARPTRMRREPTYFKDYHRLTLSDLAMVVLFICMFVTGRDSVCIVTVSQ